MFKSIWWLCFSYTIISEAQLVLGSQALCQDFTWPIEQKVKKHQLNTNELHGSRGCLCVLCTYLSTVYTAWNTLCSQCMLQCCVHDKRGTGLPYALGTSIVTCPGELKGTPGMNTSSYERSSLFVSLAYYTTKMYTNRMDLCPIDLLPVHFVHCFPFIVTCLLFPNKTHPFRAHFYTQRLVTFIVQKLFNFQHLVLFIYLIQFIHVYLLYKILRSFVL